MSRNSVDTLYITWEDVLEWGIKELRGGGLKILFCKLSLGAVVYKIWKQTNVVKHGGQPRSEEQIVKAIICEVQSRMMARAVFGKIRRIWIYALNGIYQL